MDITDRVIDRYIEVCKRICNGIGYDKFSKLPPPDLQDAEKKHTREKIKFEVLRSCGKNGHTSAEVSRLLDKLDRAIFHYLSYQHTQGEINSFNWGDYEDSIRAEMLYQLYL